MPGVLPYCISSLRNTDKNFPGYADVKVANPHGYD